LFQLFADYYNAHPDGVVNDRWNTRKPAEVVLRLPPIRALAGLAMKKAIAKNPSIVEGFIPAPIPHSDFRTPEYRKFDEVQPKKWEATRGVGQSFGYNRNDDYVSVESLIGDLVDCTSKNGNLLLNVGPRGVDAQIPSVQLARLAGIGAWLKQNGQAIYGARPWRRAEALTDAGLPVRITQRDGEVYLIVLGAPTGQRLVVRDLDLPGSVRRLGARGDVRSAVRDGDLVLEFDAPLSGHYAPVFAVRS
jgi:alpha-L-fucosidase